MEKSLEKFQQRSLSIVSDKSKRIAKVIVDVNDCLQFKIEAEGIVGWAQDLERLLPDAELHKLPFLMDCFKTDTIEWDQRKGIQNIFNGLKKIRKNDKGEYEILKAIW